MKCSQVQVSLSAYADSELTGIEMRKVREHLSQCPVCQHELEMVHSIKIHTSMMADLTPPPGLEQRLIASLERGTKQSKRNWILGGVMVTASAAAIILATRLTSTPDLPNQAITDNHTSKFETASDSAYLSGSDPMSGGVQVVAVGYAGGQ